MAASATDYFHKVGYATATTLSAPGYTIGDVAITVASTTNWPTGTGVTFAIDETELSNGEYVRSTGTYNVFRGVVSSATSITSVTYVGGDANRNYSAGSTTRVYILVSSYRDNRFTDGVLIEHEQDGTHAVELITSRTEDTDPDPDADFILTYDTSATALKKVKPSNLSGLSDGWIKNILPAQSGTITNNGNRSYDIPFASTVASILTPGMRLRTTRTVTAPTQCADLEASSSQYFTKTSPNKLTFTDDYTTMGWVKLESYSTGGIIARRNGNVEGWSLVITSTGQVQAGAYRIAVNNSETLSYQSIPLNKWTHVAATTNLSGTSVLIYIDGVLVPSVTTITGTITAIVQGTTALVVGNNTSGGSGYFDGKIAQAAVFDSVLSASTIRSYMSQGLSGSESNLLSAYSCNNSLLDLNTTTPNDLTASGGALMTNADSPFTLDANGVPSGTTDYAIVTKVVTSTATVQVPEGCTIPTSGGVSAVAYSTQSVPYGFPRDGGRWDIDVVHKVQVAVTSNATFGSYNGGGNAITAPVGSWDLITDFPMFSSTTTVVEFALATSSISGAAAGSQPNELTYRVQSAAAANSYTPFHRVVPIAPTSATTYTLWSLGATTSAGMDSDQLLHKMTLSPKYL